VSKPHYNIVFASPGRIFIPEYIGSMIRTIRWLESNKLTYTFLNKYSSFVPSARELTATNTFEQNWETQDIASGEFTYDKILWIDSDIEWDLDAFKKLWLSDKPIISGLYQTNLNGTVAVALDNGQGLPRKANKVEFLLWDEPFEAWGVGFGFVMMKHRVFESIDRPWFEIEKIRWPHMDFDTNVGEDYSFCVRARRAGFKVWVDPTVKVKHHKDTIYVVE
jgi:hypothetical protein